MVPYKRATACKLVTSQARTMGAELAAEQLGLNRKAGVTDGPSVNVHISLEWTELIYFDTI